MTDEHIKEDIKHINKRNQKYIAENNRMTEKQIIIDGKECRYWFRPNPDDYRKCSLRGKNDNCDEIKDCFVKELLGKLALKEQECEKLKKQLFSFMDGDYCTNGCSLKQQLDQLKGENVNWQKEYWKLEQGNDFLAEKNSKLRGCLTEIKEIAEKHKATAHCDYLTDMDEILQKIREVEDELKISEDRYKQECEE